MAGRSAVTYSKTHVPWTSSSPPSSPNLILTPLRPAPPEVYAKNVVRNSLSWWPSLWLWTGSESTIVWFISTFLWHTALVSATHAGRELENRDSRTESILGLSACSGVGPCQGHFIVGKPQEIGDRCVVMGLIVDLENGMARRYGCAFVRGVSCLSSGRSPSIMRYCLLFRSRLVPYPLLLLKGK